MYYEQNVNVATFDTVSVGLYSQRSTLYHTLETERLRNFKLFLMIFCSILTCCYLYYRYMINPDFEYVSEPIKKIGSKLEAYKEVKWRTLTEEEQKKQLQREAQRYDNVTSS
ncbi:hypothetical protein AGDE_01294 [Angomonas deanei]|uniref:Uncharacterized protein n=1 Tax=Angomonas deanei TaxID=59799 RepID=A0A7G2CAF9_9TRYP|nr:hypothetical protein AGDE_01294 [Angomonas deanei]CAD2215743.1 hypothetical protein, conserved [Angomonas deanei]|eukprot:EPY42629.1 hypothetical protein AGDE_01294 [Angomonas deanei]